MTKLINAVLDNDINLVKKYLSSHADVDVNAQDQNKYTALHIAVAGKGFDDIVCELLKHPDIDVNLADAYGNTALLLSCSKDDYFARELNIAKQLLAIPSLDVNVINVNGCSALYLACYRSNLDYALALLEHPDIDVNQADNEGNTALHACVFNDPHDIGAPNVEPLEDEAREDLPQIQMAKKILAINPALINTKNNDGQTILHICAMHGEWELATTLLRYPNIDVNSKDYDNKTPLHYAYQHDMKKTTDMLLKHRNINCFSEDNQGKKPFDYFQPKSSYRHDFFKAPAPVQPVKKNLDSPSLCAKAVSCLFGRFI